MDIKLKSRYGDIHVLEEIEPNVYRPKAGTSMYTRLIGELTDLEAIDFDGGPFLSKGSVIDGKTITHLEYVNEEVKIVCK